MNRSIERQRKAIRNEGKRLLKEARAKTVPKWREFAFQHGWHWPKMAWLIRREQIARRALAMAKMKTKTVMKIRSKYGR